MRTIALFLLLFLLLAPVLALSKSPKPVAPVVHGLQWTVSLQKDYTPFDALTYRAFLANAGERPVALSYKGDRPEIILALERVGAASERTLKLLPAGDLVTRRNSTVQKRESAWSIHGDLRRSFGELPPGTYEFSLHWKKGSFGIRDLDGFNPIALPSARIRFKVRATTLAAAKKANPTLANIPFTVLRRKDRWIGVLENKSDKPIVVSAYGGDRKGIPLSSMATSQRWDGTAYRGTPGGFCGTGLMPVMIKPGAKRELSLPAAFPGIHRWVVSVAIGTGDQAKSVSLVSETVLVRP